MTIQEAEELAEKAAMALSEHFDNVQILATWNHEGITSAIYRGCGNWYARQGMAHEFINQDVAQENAHQLAGKINPPTESDDEWKVVK